jgi:hypothetical protein
LKRPDSTGWSVDLTVSLAKIQSAHKIEYV